MNQIDEAQAATMDSKELVEELREAQMSLPAHLAPSKAFLAMEHAIAYITAQSQPPAAPKEYVGWTCGKCGAPVAGGFSKCDKCGRDPKAATMTEAAGEQADPKDFQYAGLHGVEARRRFIQDHEPKPAEAPTLIEEWKAKIGAETDADLDLWASATESREVRQAFVWLLSRLSPK